MAEGATLSPRHTSTSFQPLRCTIGVRSGLALALGIHLRAEMHYEKGHLHRKVPPMAKPGPHGKDKQRCGARTRQRHGFCKKWPVPGKTRCRFHGGLSTGPLTDEGKEKSLATMHEGWRRWLESR